MFKIIKVVTAVFDLKYCAIFMKLFYKSESYIARLNTAILYWEGTIMGVIKECPYADRNY
jgi:hypothetical protein